MPLAFIIPTACYLKLSDKKWRSFPKLIAIVVMVFGILVMAIGTVLAIIEVSGALFQGEAGLKTLAYLPFILDVNFFSL